MGSPRAPAPCGVYLVRPAPLLHPPPSQISAPASFHPPPGLGDPLAIPAPLSRPLSSPRPPRFLQPNARVWFCLVGWVIFFFFGLLVFLLLLCLKKEREGKGKNYSLGKAVFSPLPSPFPHVSLPSWIAIPAYIGCPGLEGLFSIFSSSRFSGFRFKAEHQRGKKKNLIKISSKAINQRNQPLPPWCSATKNDPSLGWARTGTVPHSPGRGRGCPCREPPPQMPCMHQSWAAASAGRIVEPLC